MGYSDGAGGVLIPRNEAIPTQDVLGNPLQYNGRVPYNAAQTGHDGATNGFHSGMSINLNPIGAPELVNAGIQKDTTITHGAALPIGWSADVNAGAYRNIRHA